MAGKPRIEEDPLGLEEWTKSGEFAKEILVDNDKQGHKGVFPTPFGSRVGFRLTSNKSPEPSLPCLEICAVEEFKIPLVSSVCTGGRGHQFLVKQGDVIPIYGHLYAVKGGARFVTLTRVTDQVPEKFRPSKNSRTIAITALNPSLFWELDSKSPDRKEFDTVRISKITKDTCRAKIELIPGYASSRDFKPSERMRLTMEVGKDDVLTARGRSYRVLDVVPSKQIESVGRLVGWIELSADPVEPEKKESPEP